LFHAVELRGLPPVKFQPYCTMENASIMSLYYCLVTSVSQWYLHTEPAVCCSTRTCLYCMMLSGLWPTLLDIISINQLV